MSHFLIVMLNIIMLSVVMLSVIMLNVVAPPTQPNGVFLIKVKAY